MSINTTAQVPSFAAAFARKGGENSTPAAPSERVKSQFWLNIGYSVDVPAKGDTPAHTKFVSLPYGIALDGMQALPTNQKSEEFAMFQDARNQLLNDLLALATTMKPGEEKLLSQGDGLQIQLRRISEETPALAANAANPFARKLTF